MYGWNRAVEDARQMFDEMSGKDDVFCWTVLMKCHENILGLYLIASVMRRIICLPGVYTIVTIKSIKMCLILLRKGGLRIFTRLVLAAVNHAEGGICEERWLER